MAFILLVMLPLLLSRCSPSGDRVGLSTPADTASPQVERQAIANLVQLYREAVIQEDIDRLQSLDYDSVDSGSDSVGVFAVSWSSTADGAQSKIVTIVTLGPGLQSQSAVAPILNSAVADTFDFRVLRR